ncbi:hypothetical protein ACLB2K_000396 [Fragaria x ananassa]
MMIRVSTTSQSGQDTDEYELEKTKRTKGKHNLLDRISLLPHEILVSIVSLLSLKEAAATSVLSKRWQNLWKYTMTLNFQDVDFSVGDNFHCYIALVQELRDRKNRKYVSWMDRVLEQHQGQYIERFRAYFFLHSEFKNSIDKWIEFAMQKRVQVLELQLLIPEYDYARDNYAFPHNLLGMTDEVLDYFLSNCPVLERLTVTDARGLVCLRVVGASISLKYLTVNGCPNLKSIEICNANIVSFVYRGAGMDLFISNVPFLIEVHISERALDNVDFTTLAFTRLSSCLSHLEILKLNICGVVYNQNYDFPILENLKQLELNVETDYHSALYHLSSFMKACPHIHRLVLKLDFRRTDVETTVSRAPKFPHHSLKVVEIMGYRGYECAVKHVVYLIESVVALEKIIIDPLRRWIWPPGMDREPDMVKEEVKARKHAKEHLQERVPSTIEFVCL